MTLKITVAHGSPSYPAVAVLAPSGGYTEQQAKDGEAPVERYIHSGASCVVHETQPGETLADAELRALNRMWGGYRNAAGGVSFDGKPLPLTVQELGEDRMKCWQAALRSL